MNERVRELVASTGCDERLAVVLDRFTDGDVEKARKIILSIPKDLVVLSVRAVSEREDRFVLVVHIRNLSLGTDEFSDVLVSKDRDLLAVNAESSIEVLRRAFENWRASGKVEETETRELRAYLGRDSVRRELAELLGQDPPDIERLRGFFADMLFRVLTETGSKVECACRRTDAFRLYSGERALEEAAAGAEPAGKDAGEGGEERPQSGLLSSAIFLAAQPVIAPVDGRPVPKCKPGDVVFTEVADPREFAATLKRFLLEEAKKNGYNEPWIPAVIEEMEYAVNTDQVSIVVRYGPGIYGRILVSRDLKIGTPRRPGSEEEETAGRPAYGWIVWVLVLSFVVVLLLSLFMRP